MLAGNHTLKAAVKLGWTEIAATFVDVDDEAAARIVLVDNRSNDLATYDDQALADLLSDLLSLDGSGYDDEALKDILDRITDLPPPLPDPDDAPDLIACHQQGRLSRLVELDPGYVDVICRRWQDATGEKPVLESSGVPYDFA